MEVRKQKLLILDLDETLIYATKEPLSNNWDFEVGQYKVFQRPGLKQFLDQITSFYRVAVWSSASDEYVQKVVSNIFPENYPLLFVWGRSKCTLQSNNDTDRELGYTNYYDHLNYVKYLLKVKRKGLASLEEILIVDDTPEKSRYNYGNAIYPTPFMGNLKDEELHLLLKYLIQIKDVSNFRTLEKRNWRERVL